MQNEAARQFGRLASRLRAAQQSGVGGKPSTGGGGAGRPGGAGGPPNLGAILGGSGAVIALGVGAVLVNSALFNGPFLFYTVVREMLIVAVGVHSRRWPSSDQIHSIAWRPQRSLC